jgi:hypothetical protein
LANVIYIINLNIKLKKKGFDKKMKNEKKNYKHAYINGKKTHKINKTKYNETKLQNKH